MHRRLSGQLPQGERDCLLSELTKFWFSVECDRGLNYAECAAGAVPLEETNFKTIESKIVPVSIRLARSASVMPGGWLQLSMGLVPRILASRAVSARVCADGEGRR